MKKCWFSNLVDLYHGVIKEAAKNLLDDTTSVKTIMYRLAEDRHCFKNAAARVTGTAQGWTQVPYELLTIEFLKYGLRNRIDRNDWEMIEDNHRHGWNATYAEKPLEILLQVPMKQLLRETKDKIQSKDKRKPDVVVRIGKRIIALIEIKSSFGRPLGLAKTVRRLLDFELLLGKNQQRVSAIVNYGVTWGGGTETVSEVPANFLFVSTSEHKPNAREILNVKVRDITDLIERVDRQVRY